LRAWPPTTWSGSPSRFHAQQAAEKALKAVLLTRGIRFPFVHDLERLLELLERDGVYPPGPVRDAGRLTGYAVLTRYPHDDAVTEDEFRQAIAIAEAVVRWAETEAD
jgi:HEPN domain-containing protein